MTTLPAEMTTDSAAEATTVEVLVTRRQWDVALLIHAGYTNREIAAKLYLSVDAVKTHVQAIGSRMGITGLDGMRERIAVAVECPGHHDPVLADPPPMRRALTPRETQVLELVAECYDAEHIGQILHISSHTVRSHLRRIGLAMGLPDRYRSRHYLVRMGVQYGLLAPRSGAQVDGRRIVLRPEPLSLSHEDALLVTHLAGPRTIAEINYVLGYDNQALRTRVDIIRTVLNLPASAGRDDIVAAAREHGILPRTTTS